MVLMKIFVAIILTKLQRSKSRVNVKKTYNAVGLEISTLKRTPATRTVKTDVIFEVNVEFYPHTI